MGDGRGCPTRTAPVGGREAPQAFDGGHLMLRTVELCMAWALYCEGPLQALDWRVWLACHELVERRRHAGRGKRGRQRGELRPSYTRGEVRDLVGGGGEKVRDSLRRLGRVGLVRFSPERIVFATSPDELLVDDLAPVFRMAAAMPERRPRFPMPRRTLRMLCGSTRKSTAAVVFDALLRCCFFHRGRGWDTAGRCIASSVAEAFGLSERAVHRARRHLEELEWMERLAPESARERALENRFGARYAVSLTFARTVGERGLSTPEMSCRSAASDPRMSCPESDRSLSSRTKDQRPGASPPGPRSDFSSRKGGGLPEPNWRRLVSEDLASIPRLMVLFDQVLELGHVGDAFMDRLNFCGAAQRARAKGTSNPCGLFRRLVERGLWAHVTNDDEESVRAPLTRFLNGEPEREERATERPRRRLSDDARFVQRVLAACRNRGLRQRETIFRELNRRHPEWSEPRWGRALAELEPENDDDCGGCDPCGFAAVGWS